MTTVTLPVPLGTYTCNCTIEKYDPKTDRYVVRTSAGTVHIVRSDQLEVIL